MLAPVAQKLLTPMAGADVAAPAPITMPVFCCRGGDRQASAMTTALSPDRMMLIADDLRQRDEKAHVQGHDSSFSRDPPQPAREGPPRWEAAA